MANSLIASWRAAQEYEEERKLVKETILKIIIQTQDSLDEEMNLHLVMFSDVVEKRLFEAASSLDSYIEPETLISRIKATLAELLRISQGEAIVNDKIKSSADLKGKNVTDQIKNRDYRYGNNGCSRTFILKGHPILLEEIARYFHKNKTTPESIESNDVILSFLRIAKVECCKLACQQSGLLDLDFGGSPFSEEDSSSYWTDPVCFIIWWKRNVTNKENFNQIIRDAEYSGNSRKRIQKANWCSSILPILLNIKDRVLLASKNQASEALLNYPDSLGEYTASSTLQEKLIPLTEKEEIFGENAQDTEKAQAQLKQKKRTPKSKASSRLIDRNKLNISPDIVSIEALGKSSVNMQNFGFPLETSNFSAPSIYTSFPGNLVGNSSTVHSFNTSNYSYSPFFTSGGFHGNAFNVGMNAAFDPISLNINYGTINSTRIISLTGSDNLIRNTETDKAVTPESFALKLYDIVSSEDEPAIAWTPDGQGFYFHDLQAFQIFSLLAKFKCNITQFQFQLALLGFSSGVSNIFIDGSRRQFFSHPLFIRGSRHLAALILPIDSKTSFQSPQFNTQQDYLSSFGFSGQGVLDAFSPFYSGLGLIPFHGPITMPVASSLPCNVAFSDVHAQAQAHAQAQVLAAHTHTPFGYNPFIHNSLRDKENIIFHNPAGLAVMSSDKIQDSNSIECAASGLMQGSAFQSSQIAPTSEYNIDNIRSARKPGAKRKRKPKSKGLEIDKDLRAEMGKVKSKALKKLAIDFDPTPRRGRGRPRISKLVMIRSSNLVSTSPDASDHSDRDSVYSEKEAIQKMSSHLGLYGEVDTNVEKESEKQENLHFEGRRHFLLENLNRTVPHESAAPVLKRRGRPPKIGNLISENESHHDHVAETTDHESDSTSCQDVLIDIRDYGHRHIFMDLTSTVISSLLLRGRFTASAKNEEAPFLFTSCNAADEAIEKSPIDTHVVEASPLSEVEAPPVQSDQLMETGDRERPVRSRVGNNFQAEIPQLEASPTLSADAFISNQVWSASKFPESIALDFLQRVRHSELSNALALDRELQVLNKCNAPIAKSREAELEKAKLLGSITMVKFREVESGCSVYKLCAIVREKGLVDKGSNYDRNDMGNRVVFVFDGEQEREVGLDALVGYAAFSEEEALEFLYSGLEKDRQVPSSGLSEFQYNSWTAEEVAQFCRAVNRSGDDARRVWRGFRQIKPWADLIEFFLRVSPFIQSDRLNVLWAIYDRAERATMEDIILKHHKNDNLNEAENFKAPKNPLIISRTSIEANVSISASHGNFGTLSLSSSKIANHALLNRSSIDIHSTKFCFCARGRDEDQRFIRCIGPSSSSSIWASARRNERSVCCGWVHLNCAGLGNLSDEELKEVSNNFQCQGCLGGDLGRGVENLPGTNRGRGRPKKPARTRSGINSVEDSLMHLRRSSRLMNEIGGYESSDLQSCDEDFPR